MERTAIETLRLSLAEYCVEQRRLRNIIENTSSSTLRMFSSLDLVNTAKKIEAIVKQLKRLQTQQQARQSRPAEITLRPAPPRLDTANLAEAESATAQLLH